MINYKKAFEDIKKIIYNLESNGPEKSVDKYGFYPIDENGYREVKRYNDFLNDWAVNGNKIQKGLAELLPRKFLINLGLNKEQTDLYRYNSNIQYMLHSLQVKKYNIKFPPAAKLISEAKTRDNKVIKGLYVATAGNDGYSKGKNYQKYLKSISESCIRKANKEYLLILSAKRRHDLLSQ